MSTSGEPNGLPVRLGEVCRAIGELVKASAVWGGDKAANRNADWAETVIHDRIATVLKCFLGRDPTPEEVALPWEL